MIDRDYVGHPKRRIVPKLHPVRVVPHIPHLQDSSMFRRPEQTPKPQPKLPHRADDMFVAPKCQLHHTAILDTSHFDTNSDTFTAPEPATIIAPQSHVQQQSSQMIKRQLSASQFQVGKIVVGVGGTERRKLLGLRLPRLQSALVGMAVVVFVAGMLVTIQTLFVNHDAKSQVVALAKKSTNTNEGSSAPVPSEQKPTSGGDYQVAPNQPKYLKIPKLRVDARVKALGIDSKSNLKAPYSIYDTGWYDASAHPGDPGSLGAVLIDGHVHGPTQPGVFVSIKNLVAGDTMQIVRGDNQVFNYKVVKVQNYDAATINMGMMLASVQPGQPGLNLITCGGPYNRQTGEYTERTAVFAVQI